MPAACGLQWCVPKCPLSPGWHDHRQRGQNHPGLCQRQAALPLHHLCQVLNLGESMHSMGNSRLSPIPFVLSFIHPLSIFWHVLCPVHGARCWGYFMGKPEWGQIWVRVKASAVVGKKKCQEVSRKISKIQHLLFNKLTGLGYKRWREKKREILPSI